MANRSDDFNRNNGQDLTAFPTPSDGGSSWIVPNGTGAYFNAGVLQPYLNKVNMCVLESSEADGVMSMKWTTKVSGIWMIFRYVDFSNYMMVLQFANTATLRKTVAGVTTNVGSAQASAITSGTTMGVNFVGSQIYYQQGGVNVGPGWSDSTHISATKHGLAFNGNSADQIDDFSFIGAGGGGGSSKLLLRLQEEGLFTGGRAF